MVSQVLCFNLDALSASYILHCGELHEMVDPAVPLAAVLQYVRQLFVPLGDCFLQQLNIRIVFPLIRKKFFFGKDPAHQVFIELGFEAFRLCHTFFIYPDLRGVFLGQLPVDTFLADTGQQSIQGGDILNMAF